MLIDWSSSRSAGAPTAIAGAAAIFVTGVHNAYGKACEADVDLFRADQLWLSFAILLTATSVAFWFI